MQRLWRQVAFDRLLARLFQAGQPLALPWVLKGGYAMELRIKAARTTKDIDLTMRSALNSGDKKDDKKTLAVLEQLQEAAAFGSDDFFVYTIGEPIADLDAAPYGGEVSSGRSSRWPRICWISPGCRDRRCRDGTAGSHRRANVSRNTLRNPLSTLFTAENKNPARRVWCASGVHCLLQGWLEVDLASKLEDSRVKCRRHLAESAVAEVSADVIELRMVPGVEGF